MHQFLKFIFGIILYMFRTFLSVHHQEFLTVHTAVVYAIQLASRIRMDVLILLASCQQTCMTYTIAVCTVKNS